MHLNNTKCSTKQIVILFLLLGLLLTFSICVHINSNKSEQTVENKHNLPIWITNSVEVDYCTKDIDSIERFDEKNFGFDIIKYFSTVAPIDAATQTVQEVKVVSRGEWVSGVATAYCPCYKCCGKYAYMREKDENGKDIVCGCGGKRLVEGYSIAADLKLYPLGTLIEVDGLGVFEVMDMGGSIKGNKIDIYFENHEDTAKVGRMDIKIRVVGKVQ